MKYSLFEHLYPRWRDYKERVPKKQSCQKPSSNTENRPATIESITGLSRKDIINATELMRRERNGDPKD